MNTNTTCCGNCASCGKKDKPQGGYEPVSIQRWIPDLTTFVCEEHPTQLQGHGGCEGAGMPLPPVDMPAELHPSTQRLLVLATTALAAKLHLAQQAYGHTDNWAKGDWQPECVVAMRQHLCKGDPLDVAAYGIFMWYHGWSTSPVLDAQR